MKEIAALLQLSTRTVETHKYDMMQALGVQSTAECAVKAASRNVERPGSIQVLPEPLGLSFMHHRMR